VLRAFLAPVAVMLLRLLQPLLRAMIKVLPVWFDIMETINTVVEKLNPLAKVAALLGTLAGGLAGAKIGAVVGSIVGGFLGSVVPGIGTAFGAALGAKVGAIVGGIVGGITGGVTLAGLIQSFLSGGADDGGPGTQLGNVGSRNTNTDPSSQAGRGTQLGNSQTVVNLNGSTAAVVEDIEVNSGLETP